MATSNPYLYIVPGLVYIELAFSTADLVATPSVGGYLFVSHAYYKVAAVKEIHSQAATGQLQVVHSRSGTNTVQLTTPLDLNASPDVVRTGTLIGSPTIFEPNDVLAYGLTTGVITGYEGALTIYLEKMRRWNTLFY